MSTEQTPGGNRPDTRAIYIVVGVLLIVVGLGLLAGVPVFGWSWGVLPEFVREVRRVGWPLALVLLGALVIVYSRRPGARLPTREARLTRSPEKKMIAGVLGGLSDYFGIDVTVLRIGYLAFAFLFDAWGPLLVAYIAAAVIVPVGSTAPAAHPPAPPREG